MKIISAKYIFCNGKYEKDKAIVFNDKILEIGNIDYITKKYPDTNITKYEDNSIIYPGFINMHTHLEFSANRATLKFGNFIDWLYSVFENRDSLVQNLTNDTINSAINEMARSGVTTFGAISSFGADMQECKETPLRVIYFNEVIGSSPAMVDTLFNDFKMRLEESKVLQDDRFYPAIAIHSPYAVHPFLLREVLNIARKDKLLVTAHFLESPSEREWLENHNGEFKALFEKFFNTSTPVNSIDEFLNAFKGIKTLFTHCTQAKDKEFDFINENNSTVIHCPRSNRLLNCGRLDINKVKNLTLGSDGYSSNFSLSILDELKAALFMHTDIDLNNLALKLINSVTINATNALNIKVGDIKEGFNADFAIFTLPNDLKDSSDTSLALHTIINCNKANKIFIAGDELILD